MSWYKIELTEEQLNDKEDVKIESMLSNNPNVLSVSSANKSKTVYFSSNEAELKNVSLTEYNVSSCSPEELKDLDSTSE